MGSATFVHERTSEKNARDAFKAAREEALYNHGHSGYSGTIAEKDSFVVLPCIEGKTPRDSFFDVYIDDPRIYDKYGPAGCIETENGFVFFGWAAC